MPELNLPPWALGLAVALIVVLALELVFVLLRRTGDRFRLRIIYHLFGLAGGATAGLAVAGLRSAESASLRFVYAATIILGSIVLFAVLDGFVLQRPGRQSGIAKVPKLLRDILRLIVVVGAALVALGAVYQAELSAVLVSSTVISAVVGFALQDVLKNIFAGISLDIEKPFRRGDWLSIDGQHAQVVEMSWRSTHLRTPEGVDIYEPNGDIATSRLLNYGSGHSPVAFVLSVGLPYDAPPAKCREALLVAAESAPGAVDSPRPQVFLSSFDDSSIAYSVRVWTRDVGNVQRFRDGVNRRIWYKLRRAGLSIPFPIRTVFMEETESAKRAEAGSGPDRAVVSMLAANELFGDLNSDVLNRLAAGANRLHYDSGETLVREGESGDSLFVVETGRAMVSKSGAELGTGTISLAQLGPGDLLGEMSLLTGEPRAATITADGPLTALKIDRRVLKPILEADPSIAENLSKTLAARQKRMDKTLKDRREQKRSAAPTPEEEAGFLERMRSFFKLS